MQVGHYKQASIMQRNAKRQVGGGDFTCKFTCNMLAAMMTSSAASTPLQEAKNPQPQRMVQGYAALCQHPASVITPLNQGMGAPIESQRVVHRGSTHQRANHHQQRHQRKQRRYFTHTTVEEGRDTMHTCYAVNQPEVLATMADCAKMSKHLMANRRTMAGRHIAAVRIAQQRKGSFGQLSQQHKI